MTVLVRICRQFRLAHSACAPARHLISGAQHAPSPDRRGGSRLDMRAISIASGRRRHPIAWVQLAERIHLKTGYEGMAAGFERFFKRQPKPSYPDDHGSHKQDPSKGPIGF